MTLEEQRAYVQGWKETGRILEEIRWRELREIDDRAALVATDSLIEIGAMTPISERRRSWSGLIEQQALFHRPSPA